jgi:micrococcal nuclease
MKNVKYYYLLTFFLFLSSLSFASDNSIVTACTRVVDGDTIVITGNEKVRLIGADCPAIPESDKLDKDAGCTGKDKRTIQALRQQAGDYTKQWLEGKRIRLEFDPENEYCEHRDKYGRLLAYVYVEVKSQEKPKDYGKKIVGEYAGEKQISGVRIYFYEVFFNAQIICDGYAYVYTGFPFEYINDFRRYEIYARENKKGLWADRDF